jgi:hypothetical protein
MEISFSYEVGWDDYLDSQTTYNRHSEAVRKSIKRTRLSMLSFYVFLLLVLYPALEGLLRILVLGGILILGIAHICLVRELYETRVARLSRKMIRQAGSDDVVGEKRIKIHGDEIFYKEATGTTKLEIGNISQVLESKINYYIFMGEARAVIIPKDYEGETETQKLILGHLRSRMEGLQSREGLQSGEPGAGGSPPV